MGCLSECIGEGIMMNYVVPIQHILKYRPSICIIICHIGCGIL